MKKNTEGGVERLVLVDWQPQKNNVGNIPIVKPLDLGGKTAKSEPQNHGINQTTFDLGSYLNTVETISQKAIGEEDEKKALSLFRSYHNELTRKL